MPIIVYNATIIENWENQTQEILKLIQSDKSEIDEKQKQLSILSQNSFEQDKAILSTQRQIDSLKLQNQSAQYNHHNQHNHHQQHNHYHQNAELIPNLMNRLEFVNLLNTENDLNELKGQQTKTLKDIIDTRNIIEKLTKNLKENEQKHESLERLVAAGKAFLTNLDNDPALLVTTLTTNILDKIKAYNDANPTEDSPEVRICMYKIQEKLDYINSSQEQDKKQQQRVNYLRLCALLQQMHQQAPSSSFKELLDKLLDTTHIGINEDLPDNFATGKKTNEHYQELKNSKPELFSMTQEQLEAAEINDYKSIIETLRNCNKNNNKLKEKINSAITVIQNEVQVKRQQKSLINYHFYNCALNDLHQLAINPKNHEAAGHLALMANKASGAPSISKQVRGSLEIIVGLLIVAASIACLVFTFGGSSFGIAFGLERQVVAAVAAGVLAVGGVNVSALGFFTAQAGQRNGLSKELENVHKEAINSSHR